MESELDWDELTMEEVQEALAAYALKLHQMEKRCKDLQDTITKREQWLSKAKMEAGYGLNKSFDVVWAETLAKAKELDRQKRDEALRLLGARAMLNKSN